MKLLIDIGNTRSKYIKLEAKLKMEQICLTSTDICSVNNNDLTLDYIERNWFAATEIVLASVNCPSLTSLICSWAQDNNLVFTEVKTEAVRHGVTCAYQQPSNLGIDRWLTLVGAHSAYPNKNVLIIDSGTATTVDLLTADGKHQGGWIVPGLDLLYQSLMTNTANINANKESIGEMAFGKSTSDCVNHGILAMTVGLINQAISEAEQLQPIDEVLLCGGNGARLQPLIKHTNINLDEALVFKGLQQYLDH